MGAYVPDARVAVGPEGFEGRGAVEGITGFAGFKQEAVALEGVPEEDDVIMRTPSSITVLTNAKKTNALRSQRLTDALLKKLERADR